MTQLAMEISSVRDESKEESLSMSRLVFLVKDLIACIVLLSLMVLAAMAYLPPLAKSF